MRTDEFEDLLREALDHQAAQAPGGARVLAALAPRTRRRRWWMPVGGVVTAGLVGIAMVSASESYEQAAPGTSLQVSPPAEPGNVYWEPTWLPSGMVEQERSYAVDDTWVGSIWASGPGTAAPWVHVISVVPGPGQPTGPDPGHEQVLVNGRPGEWTVSSDPRHEVHTLTWWAGSRRFDLLGSSLPDPKPALLRIAESLRPTAVEPTAVPFTFAAVPGARVDWSGISGDRPDRAVMITNLGFADVGVARIEVRPDQPVLEGARVPVRGGEGWFRMTPLGLDEPSGVLVADLDGRWLVVSFLPTAKKDPVEQLDLLTTVANSVTVGPTPAAPWLGRRP
ncbi:hypothetical protein [Actinokineospora cianjurensis]|uniref:Uncharacterized protein n=1 Tax=Actinokineospora cianjurensis TaxID=585224 RepID=A0A421B9B2_9PSEU|nr:hypothetical protein [Actinokineospora cianjurensis]RLK61122.1 hypothetical protein CLV68_1637 [Actinokineospora cianjurensis]